MSEPPPSDEEYVESEGEDEIKEEGDENGEGNKVGSKKMATQTEGIALTKTGGEHWI